MQFAERDTRSVKPRILLLEWVIVVTFIALGTGFWRLQIFEAGYYSYLAERNHLKSLPIAAPRGRMLDRNNRVLVDNFPSFTILAQWEFLKSLQEHVGAIAEGLGMDPADLAKQIETSRKRMPYKAVVIRDKVSRRDIAFVETHRVEFPELDLVSVESRLYPPEGFGANLFGYVGEVSDSDLDRPELALAEPGEQVGKSGLEREYDAILRGQDGERRVIVNSRGADMGVLDEKPPVAGHSLHLTIDYDLQQVAEESFQGDNGALVALDPRTGEVLAMISRPAFDPNLFSKGISRADWNELIHDPRDPLLNRAIQAQLAPGSVYKVLLATAALESGSADMETSFYCPGGATFYGRFFKCWEKKGHGRVNIHQAIVHSCDVFFYNLGKNLGIDAISEYSTSFGLGHKTGIDLPNEETGTMPSEEWKERVFHEKWYAGETISISIGQGALTVTPLQVAYSVGGIASGGYFPTPHLVSWKELESLGRKPPAVTERRAPLSDQTVIAVTDGMYGVVNEGGGTGGRARIPGVDVAGKTGSAQVASVATAKGAKGSLKDNAWFVGLAPRRNPEIAVAVLYQGGEHGYLAAPIAKAVIKAYFDKKNGVQPRFAVKPEPGATPEAAGEIAATGGRARPRG
jgi:penicillin-binding protein 2